VRWKLTKKQKLFIPVFLFRRRADDTFPPSTPEYEIETEGGGYYFITEGSSSSLPTYIITE